MITAKDTIIDTSGMTAKKLLLNKGCVCNVKNSIKYGVSERIAINSGKDIKYLDKKVGGRLHVI